MRAFSGEIRLEENEEPMPPEFAEVQEAEIPQSAEVVDAVAPEDVAPEEAVQDSDAPVFELASRGAKLSRAAWEAIPDGVRGELEPFLRAGVDVDSALRAVTGKLDKEREERRQLEIKHIEAETRAKTLAEMQAAAPKEPAWVPKYSVDQIAEGMARASREAAELAERIAEAAAAGYDVSSERAALAEKKKIHANLDGMLRQTREYHATAERTATEKQRAEKDSFVNPIAYHRDMMALREFNDDYAGWAAQQVGIPKPVILDAMTKADAHLGRTLGVTPLQIAQDPDLLRRREELISYTVEMTKANGIAEPTTGETKGPGGARAADPPRLPSSGRSAGRAPTTTREGYGAMTGTSRRITSLETGLSPLR